jgi:hypothetical protein
VLPTFVFYVLGVLFLTVYFCIYDIIEVSKIFIFLDILLGFTGQFARATGFALIFSFASAACNFFENFNHGLNFCHEASEFFIKICTGFAENYIYIMLGAGIKGVLDAKTEKFSFAFLLFFIWLCYVYVKSWATQHAEKFEITCFKTDHWWDLIGKLF